MIKILGFLIAISFAYQVNAQSVTLPYYTGFDSTAEQAGWQEYRLGVLNSYEWVYDGFNSSSPPNSLYHDYPLGGSPTDTVEDWFVSPPINFSSPGKLSLRTQVYAIANVAGPSDYFGIWFSSGIKDPASGNFVEIVDLTSLASDQFNLWIDTGQINLPFTTDSGYIAFMYKSTDNWFDIHVDDVMIILDSTVSVKKNDKADSIGVKIFPNPNVGLFTLKMELKENTELSIKLYQFTSQLIYSEEIGKVTGYYSRQIDLSGYSKGVYFVQISTDNNVFTRKVVLY
jgi:hypothetical protein